LLSLFYKSFNTKNHTFSELASLIDINFGKLNFKMVVGENGKIGNTYEQAQQIKKYLTISGKFLNRFLEGSVKTLQEILTDIVFSKDILMKKINETVSGTERNIKTSAYSYATSRIKSYITHSSVIEEEMNGVSFYLQILDMKNNFEKEADSYIEQLNKVYSKILKEICSLTIQIKHNHRIMPMIKNRH